MKTAAERLILPRHYIPVREAGATHAEAMEALSLLGDNGYGYVSARKAGATHAEVMEIIKIDRDIHDALYTYAYARRNGVTHAEIIDAANKGCNIGIYNSLRHNQATHTEIMEVLATSADIYVYANTRYARSISHGEAMEVISAAPYALAKYNSLRTTYGATHAEAMKLIV